jgi:SEC-C motif-containing protein
MRSRYSAYALHKPEYIIRTTHPDNPHYKGNHDQWSREILDFCQNTEFSKLYILEVSKEGDLSYVTFNAHLIQNHQEKQLIEKSSFVKVGKQWLYRDAISIRMISDGP